MEPIRWALDAGPVKIEPPYPHVGQRAELAWMRRDNITLSGRLSVALAVRLGEPLVTANAT
jgi:hypothetical protein